MKNRIGKTIITLLAVIALLTGISKTVMAADTDITVGKEYMIGDTITTQGLYYINDDFFNFIGISETVVVSGINYVEEVQMWEIALDTVAPSSFTTYVHVKDSDTTPVIGFIVKSGTGTTTTDPYVLELIHGAPVTEYPLWVGGKQVTSKYLSNETEGWSYDPDTRTLTLENANITGTYDHHCIHVERLSGTLTISLKGDNNVGNKDAYYDIYSIITELLITGDGSLTVSGAKDIGIQGSSLIKIKDTTVKISDVGDFGISSGAGLIIENSTVTVSSSDCGFNLGGVLITDSKVDVTGSDFGILVDDLYVSGDSYVSAGKADSGSKTATVAIYAEKTFDIADLDIIEPEDGSIDIRTIDGHDVKTVINKKGIIAEKAVVAQTYAITFKNDDGTVLQEKNTPVYETPKYEGNTPTKKSDGSYTYTFKGWDKQITEVKDNETYTAVYDRTPIEQPEPTPTTPYNIPKTGIE